MLVFAENIFSTLYRNYLSTNSSQKIVINSIVWPVANHLTCTGSDIMSDSNATCSVHTK